MKRPPVGLLASCGALFLALTSFAAAQERASELNWQQGRAPQKIAGKAAPSSNAPGTAAPSYNQQRTGSVDPAAVTKRNSPTLAAPIEPTENFAPQFRPAKPAAVKQAAYVNAPRELPPARESAAQYENAAPRELPTPRNQTAARRLEEPRRDERVAPTQYPEYVDDPTLYDEGPGGCATCGPGGCTAGNCGESCGNGCIGDCVPCNYFDQCGWYIGADYVNARVNFSDPAAIVVRQVAGGGFDLHDQIIPYETGYQSTYRVNAGYRWGACGESLNFSYFNFNSATVVNSPDVNANVVVAGPFALNCNPGEHLRTGLDVSANVYDLDYAKRIPICSCNNDPCGGCGCPPWALTWSAGARIGTLDLTSPTQLFDVNGALAVDALSEVTFRGAGPRVGLEGRRYLGDCARWSVYGKSSLSLLLGHYDVDMRLVDLGGLNGNARQELSYTRIVPVIDLEVGLTRQLGKKTMLTAGYFMQTWIDASTVNNLNQPGVGQLAPANVDDANMTMFDGFMVRIERVF